MADEKKYLTIEEALELEHKIYQKLRAREVASREAEWERNKTWEERKLEGLEKRARAVLDHFEFIEREDGVLLIELKLGDTVFGWRSDSNHQFKLHSAAKDLRDELDRS